MPPDQLEDGNSSAAMALARLFRADVSSLGPPFAAYVATIMLNGTRRICRRMQSKGRISRRSRAGCCSPHELSRQAGWQGCTGGRGSSWQGVPACSASSGGPEMRGPASGRPGGP